MNVEEYFDYRKGLIIDKDIHESHTRIDISAVKSDEEKLDKAIKGLLGFLNSSGFSEEDIYNQFIVIAKSLLDHPDNLDFSVESIVEEHLNNSKEFDDFVQNVQNTEDEAFLKEVYRSWVLTHLEKEEKSD